MRGKILLLFVVMAILPLLIVAAVMHRQSLAALEAATQLRLLERAATTAQLLSQEAAAAEQALRIIALLSRSDPDDADPSSEVPSAFLDLYDSGLGTFEHLEILDISGARMAEWGLVRDDTPRCGGGGRSALLRAEVPLDEAGSRLVGAYRIGGSLHAGGTTVVSVVDREGRVVLSSSCEATAPLPATTTGAGAAAFQLDGSDHDPQGTFGAYAPVEGTPWTAVVTTPASLRGPVGRIFRNYWWFVLGVGAATLLAFSLLMRRVTSSIEDLTRAANRVGEGELRPWLPPPGTDEVGRLTLAFSRMTDRVRTKLELVDRNGRLAVMGQLSEYLAHEIRNPLSAVKMNLQRLQRWERQGRLPEHCRDPIDVSLKEVDRLSRTVSDVLQLGRAQDQPPDVVSLHEVVLEAIQLLQNEFDRNGVEIRSELGAQSDRVLARAGQLKGAIINLMLNALEAQPGGGALSIRSALAPGDGGARGPRLELRFRDDGPGVPSEIRDRILEPFFTTKQHGSGIGLAVASQGIRENGGELFLEEPARLHQGAEFVISFPLAALSSDLDTRSRVPELAPWMEKASIRKTASDN
jgi:signal transduction histidine kinase